MTAGTFLIPTGIYDKVISILENPRVSDTRGQTFSRSARVFVIPVENTRGYTPGPRIPAQHWLAVVLTVLLPSVGGLALVLTVQQPRVRVSVAQLLARQQYGSVTGYGLSQSA